MGRTNTKETQTRSNKVAEQTSLTNKENASGTVGTMDSIWAETLEILEREVSESRFRSLFLRMSPLSLSEDGLYTLGVPTKFYQRFVENEHLSDITQTLRKVSGREDLETIVLIMSLLLLIIRWRL